MRTSAGCAGLSYLQGRDGDGATPSSAPSNTTFRRMLAWLPLLLCLLLAALLRSLASSPAPHNRLLRLEASPAFKAADTDARRSDCHNRRSGPPLQAHRSPAIGSHNLAVGVPSFEDEGRAPPPDSGLTVRIRRRARMMHCFTCNAEMIFLQAIPNDTQVPPNHAAVLH